MRGKLGHLCTAPNPCLSDSQCIAMYLFGCAFQLIKDQSTSLSALLRAVPACIVKLLGMAQTFTCMQDKLHMPINLHFYALDLLFHALASN